MVHLISGNVKYKAIAEGDEWRRGAPAIDVDGDRATIYRQTADAMIEAWQRPGALDREIYLPSGPGGGQDALFIHLAEALVHGWDLAVALGRRPPFDDRVAEVSLESYSSWLPPQRPAGVPFAEPKPVDDGAPPIDRLAAYLGRDLRAWHPSPSR